MHEGILRADGERVGHLVDSLASGADDRLWPHGSWPAMRLDPCLSVGAKGGHGPIRPYVRLLRGVITRLPRR